MPVTLFSGNSSLSNYNNVNYLVGIEFRNVSVGNLIDFKLQVKGQTAPSSGTEFVNFRVMLGRSSDVITNQGIHFFKGKLELTYDSYTSLWNGLAEVNKSLPDRYITSNFVALFPLDPNMNWPVPLLAVSGWSTSPNAWPMNSGVDQAYVEVEI